ncbi:hypothetical protein MMAD_38810 [Mycolicibacterium madagascariense]|uniref:2-phospho-L-lactate guanylyltransferase n=1 Tax=Mycolicibacterium madagascariense TaxID=212765 RepID=A0A7I7XK74_9MYCO|nr:2-C-methyl-D-erythritol 4-phosphate cytidylyltransferase [Mycolicibacterium madagascariense]MCV7011234.1 2-C-methyl-D-erythritol 4-phosphate cytidylyltransferase [Mycolicibacterium madagascariense]BBZ29586.1 hypothetical protein MMAD_38810 [Mycolicibacterium madagascariense]
MPPWVIVPLPETLDPAAALTPVAGESPLVRVVRSMAEASAPGRVVVVSTAPHVDAADTLRAAGLDAVPVITADLAASRRDVLAAGLRHLGVQRDSRDPVLVCDCLHPLSPVAVAGRVADALARGHDVVVPILAVTDTVKTVDAGGSVLGTVDRTILRTVQFPRGFAASALWDLVAAPSPATVAAVADVDEFGAALRAGLDIGTVAGDPDAARVELPRDTDLLAAVIASGGPPAVARPPGRRDRTSP